MSNEIALIAIAVCSVLLSALFSGAETGMYQLSRLRLRLGMEKKRLSAMILGKAVRDSTGLLLSLLIGNNLANYAVTSIATYMLLTRMHVTGGAAELLATCITTPMLFTFAELIPKNVFFYRADSLMSRFAPVLFVFHKAFTWCGAVPVLKLMSDILARLMGSRVPTKTLITAVHRHHIRTIFQDSHEEGILSAVQVNIINRLVTISNTRIRSVMTPLNRVQMIDVHSDKSALRRKLKECEFTRLLVHEGRPDNIVGFVNIYDALYSSAEFADLHGLVRPLRRFSANVTVAHAIDRMRAESQKIALVMRTSRTGRERPVGIVTMKDLAEELLGELAEW
jgi:CBS domain containing-hemolysin-like protein